MRLQGFRRPAAVALALIIPFGLVACGESSSEKATKQVCSSTDEISTQLKKLESLALTSSFPAEAKASVEAIDKSIGKINEAAPNLPTSSKEEIDAANKAFQAEIAAITLSVTSAAKSSNVEAALKAAEPKIKASLTKVANAYKKAFEALKCS